MNIKDLVKGKVARFLRYRCGNAYYGIEHEGRLLSFPVPLSDIGDATLPAQDKAIFLMRYIRTAMEAGTLVPEAN